MKISKKLPQFNEENALIIVTGKQESKFYRANSGRIEEIRIDKIPRPKYSDREGFFMQSGKGRVMVTGSVYEPPKKQIQHDFSAQFKKDLNYVKSLGLFTNIYLFSPRHLLEQTKKFLTPYYKEKLHFTCGKDYFHKHPFELLTEIKKWQERKNML